MSESTPPAPDATAELVRVKGGVLFVYETSAFRLEVKCRGQTLTIHHTKLDALGILDQLESIVDAWWALAPVARIDRIEVNFRRGDPYETYQLRPVPE